MKCNRNFLYNHDDDENQEHVMCQDFKKMLVNLIIKESNIKFVLI